MCGCDAYVFFSLGWGVGNGGVTCSERNNPSSRYFHLISHYGRVGNILFILNISTFLSHQSYQISVSVKQMRPGNREWFVEHCTRGTMRWGTNLRSLLQLCELALPAVVWAHGFLVWGCNLCCSVILLKPAKYIIFLEFSENCYTMFSSINNSLFAK